VIVQTWSAAEPGRRIAPPGVVLSPILEESSRASSLLPEEHERGKGKRKALTDSEP
jgi:hypothetical protein